MTSFAVCSLPADLYSEVVVIDGLAIEVEVLQGEKLGLQHSVETDVLLPYKAAIEAGGHLALREAWEQAEAYPNKSDAHVARYIINEALRNEGLLNVVN